MKITRSAEPVVVRISGRVDFSATDEFAAAIADATVVDLTEVTWLGAAACAELVWAHQTGGGLLRVLPPPRSRVEDAEAITGLTAGQRVAPRLSRQQRHHSVPSTREQPVGVG